MKRFALLTCAAVAAAFATSDAEAGHRNHNHYRNGGFSISFGNGGFYGSYANRYYNSRRNFYPSRGHVHRQWHDTSHYDYHPPELVPHGNHFHYQPGHYDLHQTGHWDYYRH